MTRKKLTDYPKLPYNPFRVDGTKVRGIGKNEKLHEIDRVAEQGEVRVLSRVEAKKRPYGDFEEHIRVFIPAIDLLVNLGVHGLKVFGYMCKTIKKGTDLVVLKPDSVANDTKLARVSVYTGIIDLLESGFIYRAEKNYNYYINPALLFKNNRVKWFEGVLEFDETHTDAMVIRPKRMRDRKPVVVEVKEKKGRKKKVVEEVVVPAAVMTVGSLDAGDTFEHDGELYVVWKKEEDGALCLLKDEDYDEGWPDSIKETWAERFENEHEV